MPGEEIVSPTRMMIFALWCDLTRRIGAQPLNELVEGKVIGTVQTGNETKGFIGGGRETGAVDGKKSVGHGKGRPLVAVDEGMVLRQAFPERCSLLDQIAIIAGLRAIECCFQQAAIPDAVGTAIAFDLI